MSGCCTWCAMRVRVAISQICMRGLVGDSNISSLVCPGTRAFSTALHTSTMSSDVIIQNVGRQPPVPGVTLQTTLEKSESQIAVSALTTRLLASYRDPKLHAICLCNCR